tara:strand:+ start:2573 stop:3103 length:531 start_codon:yes stop_codon:yes gene_type:complete
VAYRITLECPKDPGKKYFCKKFFKYSNSMNLYFNNVLLFGDIDDAEEKLPLKFAADVDVDFKVDNVFKLEYNIRIGHIEEYAQVYNKLSNQTCTTNIYRNNYVQGSNTLSEDYKITFDVNGRQQHFGTDWHKGDSKHVEFDLPYNLPLSIQWYSMKRFTNMPGTTWDHIIIRMEKI